MNEITDAAEHTVNQKIAGWTVPALLGVGTTFMGLMISGLTYDIKLSWEQSENQMITQEKLSNMDSSIRDWRAQIERKFQNLDSMDEMLRQKIQEYVLQMSRLQEQFNSRNR
jgi:hypothetical protein